MDEDLDNLGRYEKKIMGIEEEINEGDLDEDYRRDCITSKRTSDTERIL